MDAAYYYVNAVNLAEGRGFVEDFVWNYLNEPGLPPQPSHLYWMPLTSILAAGGMVVSGLSYRAAQLPFVLLSAALAPLSYIITGLLWQTRLEGADWWRVGRFPARWFSWLAGLLAIFSGFYMPYWTAIDNFTPFALSGALALLTAAIPLNNPRPELDDPTFNWLIVSGGGIGLAHLARADGLLLLLVIVMAYLVYFGIRSPMDILLATLYLLLGYSIVMAPWFIRNWQVVGVPLPAGGSQAMWLTNYDDLFSYGQELSAETFLAQGFETILASWWWAFKNNLQRIVAEWGMIFLLPWLIIGAWQLRRHFLVQLTGLYAFSLFIVMTFIFTFPGVRGGLFHSAGALLPIFYAVAMIGLNDVIDWAAIRRRGWNARLAKYVFGTGLIVIAIALSSLVYYQRVLAGGGWNNADRFYPAIAQWVTERHPEATVMIGNPPAYRYHGGGLSVIVPNEPLTTTVQVIDRYQVDYLVLDPNHPQPLTDFYGGRQTHPRLSLVAKFGSQEEIYLFEVQ